MSNKTLSKSGNKVLLSLVNVYENSHKIKTYERLITTFGCGCELLRFLFFATIFIISLFGMKMVITSDEKGWGIFSMLVFICSSIFLLKNEPTKKGFILFQNYLKKYLALPFLKMKKKSYQKNMGETNELLKKHYSELKNWFNSYSDKDLLENMIIELGYFETTQTSLENTQKLRKALSGKVESIKEKAKYEAPVTVSDLEKMNEKVNDVKFFGITRAN